MTQVTCDPNDVANNKVMGILAYFIFFLPLLTAKDSRFAKYHANQSLICVICYLCLMVGMIVISILIGMVLPTLGLIVWLIGMLVYLGVFVLWILGLVNAINGVCKPMPLIGELFTLIKYD